MDPDTPPEFGEAPHIRSPEREPENGPSLAPISGLAVVMILCCAAGPLLLSAGGLAAIGTALRNPYLIGIAALTAVVGIAITAYRHRARTGCRPPRSDTAAGHDPSPPQREEVGRR